MNVSNPSRVIFLARVSLSKAEKRRCRIKQESFHFVSVCQPFQSKLACCPPKIKLLEVESSWEGRPTTIVVAMTEDQVRSIFGAKTKMRKLAARRTASQI
jgi:hypothetical protein